MFAAMPRTPSLLPLLLRPRAQLSGFATASRLRAHATATATATPSDAVRAADIAAAEAATDADNATPPAPKPVLPSDHATAPSPRTPSKPSKPSTSRPAAAHASTLNLPPPKYHVSRSASKNLPVYSDTKRGGNLHLTTVRKITGDISALRDELRVFLNKENGEVTVNNLTQHVIVKGHHVPQISEFLKARGM